MMTEQQLKNNKTKQKETEEEAKPKQVQLKAFEISKIIQKKKNQKRVKKS